MMNRLAVVALTIASALSIGASAQITDARTTTILRRAMAYQFQFRAGQTGIVPEYVAMLEEATARDPEDADLWNAMGVAYLAQAARAMMPGGRPADALPAMPKGLAALERAMRLNPNHAEALATHGGVQAFMGLYQQGPAGAAKGVAEMNRAIALTSTPRPVPAISLASSTHWWWRRPGQPAPSPPRAWPREPGRSARGRHQEAARAGRHQLPDVPCSMRAQAREHDAVVCV